VKEILNDYLQIIAKDLTELERTNIVKHHINTENTLLIRQHYYRMSLQHQHFIKEEIDQLLQQKLIIPFRNL
jgi:hypothetical protein